MNTRYKICNNAAILKPYQQRHRRKRTIVHVLKQETLSMAPLLSFPQPSMVRRNGSDAGSYQSHFWQHVVLKTLADNKVKYKSLIKSVTNNKPGNIVIKIIENRQYKRACRVFRRNKYIRRQWTAKIIIGRPRMNSKNDT